MLCVHLTGGMTRFCAVHATLLCCLPYFFLTVAGVPRQRVEPLGRACISYNKQRYQHRTRNYALVILTITIAFSSHLINGSCNICSYRYLTLRSRLHSCCKHTQKKNWGTLTLILLATRCNCSHGISHLSLGCIFLYIHFINLVSHLLSPASSTERKFGHGTKTCSS